MTRPGVGVRVWLLVSSRSLMVIVVRVLDSPLTEGLIVMTISVYRPQAVSRLDWRHSGSCVGMDPELFFPAGTSGPAAGQDRRAKRICRTCPVMLECLDWAMRSGQDDGVWGGCNADERRHIYATRRAAVPADFSTDLADQAA